MCVKIFNGCGESIKDFFYPCFLGFGFRGFGFCDLRRPHKPRLKNRRSLGVKPMHNKKSAKKAFYKNAEIGNTLSERGWCLVPSLVPHEYKGGTPDLERTGLTLLNLLKLFIF